AEAGSGAEWVVDEATHHGDVLPHVARPLAVRGLDRREERDRRRKQEIAVAQSPRILTFGDRTDRRSADPLALFLCVGDARCLPDLSHNELTRHRRADARGVTPSA